MEPLYVLVHSDMVESFGKLGILGWLSRKGRKRISEGKKNRELERIKREEDYLLVDGFPREIPEGLPDSDDGREIRVCGAFRDICVTVQLNALLKRGYNAVIYEPATI